MAMKSDVKESNTTMTMLILLFISTLPVMAAVAIAPGLPEMENHFQNVPNVGILVRLTMTIPALAIAIGAPFIGVIIDKWGRKKLLIISTIFYGITGSTGFYLDSLSLIFVGRLLLGLAVAGIMTISTTLIADYYQGGERNTVMGYRTAFMALSGVVFLTVSGFLANIGWHIPFLLYLGSLFLLPGILKYLYESEPSLNEQRNEENRYIEPKISGKHSFPYKNVIIIYALIFVVQLFFYLTVTELPFFLTQFLSLDPGLVGIILASLTLSGGIISLFYDRVKQKFSFEVIIFMGFVLYGLGFFMISFSTTTVLVFLSLLISGLGFGLLAPNLAVWIVADIPEATRGRILSGFTSFLFLGQFFSPLFSQTLLQIIGFVELFVVAGIALTSIGIIFLGLHVRQLQQQN
jgi:MFS family permease